MPLSSRLKVALRPLKTPFYAVDDFWQRAVYERPSTAYREKLLREIPWPGFQEKAEQLCRHGILILPGHFQGEWLDSMRADFSRWVGRVSIDYAGRYLMNETMGFCLRESEAFSRAAMDPWILALGRYYWGKPIVLADSSGYRLDPDPGGKKQGPFQWHHDANRKQLKALLYLDDVTQDGQRMDYLRGTHQIWHRFSRLASGYQETRIPDEAVVPYGEPLRCHGPAGTVLLFDTNGIHRGNQNLSAKRDVWVFQYTAGRHLGPVAALHPNVVKRLNPEQKQIARLSSRNVGLPA